ncbi:MAG: ABC transporter ATP-binding protein/permease [Vallitalea sp.]|jgi:ATP-binding cassette subfamily B protein|nr:ABC transporter ATP-binding protein/permease [Vallitalea sp.]MCT4597700.1 ABC transporter ATP-binding protein/permease [Vallitalea sp.]
MKKKSWLSYLFSHASYCKGKIILSIILSIISVMAGLIPFICVYNILKAFIENTVTVNTIVIWSVISIISYIIKVVCFGISTGISHVAAYTILEKIRMGVADKFLRAPLGKVMEKSIGEIKNIIVDQIESIEPPLAHMIPEAIGNLLLPSTIFIFLLIFDWRMALASIVTIPLTMIPFSITMKKSQKKFEKYMESSNQVSSAIVEYIEGIQVIKAFGQTGKSYEKFSNAIIDYKIFILEWMSSTWVSFKLCFAIFPSTLLGTLPMGLLLYTKNVLTPAEICLCLMLSMSMIGSLSKIEVFMNDLKKMGFTIYTVQDFLDMEELSEPIDNAILSGYDVNLSNVSFSYTEDKETEVLHSINLKLPQNSFTALVGPSGGGKSTVAKLLSRFYDVTDGEIKIGDINIKDMPLSQLSNIVSFVTQDNFLFNCSLLENIRLGNPKATDQEVYNAAKAAQCDEFILKFEDGYNTSAGEAGNRLSGGEKQRIAIARMILKNAPIVILDEATAFTDPENEDKIQRSIAALTKGKTLLVIAHRLSTIKNADNIVVLKNGNIIAQGNQEELIKNCTLYRDMWKSHIGTKAWAVSQKKEACINV